MKIYRDPFFYFLIHISENSLECVISARKTEARKSVVVQVNSAGSFSELYSYCSQFGDISNIHHYTLQNQVLIYL